MTTVVAIADLHVGSTVGLLAPGSPGEDGMTVQLSRTQRWLWAGWQRFWAHVSEVRGERLVLLLLGDICDGSRSPVQQWTRDLVCQVNAACLALERARQIAPWDDGAIFWGTPYHAGEAGLAERELAARLGLRDCGWQRVLEIDGVHFDCAHAAPQYTVPWVRGSHALRLAAAVRTNCLDAGRPIPDFVLRAHAHKVGDTGLTYAKPRAIVLPAWQTMTGYVSAHRPLGGISDIGGVIIQTDSLGVEIWRQVPKARQGIQ